MTVQVSVTDRFHSRGQQLCKFLGTKEGFLHEKRFQSPQDFLDTNMAAVSLFMAAVTSCENDPCIKVIKLE